MRLLLGGAKDKARRGYREANAMSERDGRQKSECPHSTSAAGEPPREPVKGKEGTLSQTVGQKHGEGIEPQLRVNVRPTDSKAGEADPVWD